MSRVAKRPVDLLEGVKFASEGNTVKVEGKKGMMSMRLHDSVEISQENEQVIVKPKVDDKPSWAMAGTMRALINNMVVGVTEVLCEVY